MRLSVFDSNFREDLAYWIGQDRKTALRIMHLIEAVMRDPFRGEGKPEPSRDWDQVYGPGASRASTGSSIW